ncbi:MAG: tRNA uridine-5-carboxymethylaminomethyl(34) synthesis enzyme MnmG, partial [Clostridia bacterium]
GQADKTTYHLDMKKTLESTPNLTILQAEVAQLLSENGKIVGVKTAIGQTFFCNGVVIASGVYLNSSIIIGDFRQNIGPNNFARATSLTQSLVDLGVPMRRFKTGTPARVDKNSINFDAMEIQNGDENIYPFSFMTDGYINNTTPCYLTYTTQRTKDIIMANISRSPLYNGSIKSIGPRYCPSIEDKIMRFADKERHQIFIEPESAFTNEVYVQGMSSSMPFDVQLAMYHTVLGLENARIMRFAYAIEYDCIDSICLDNSLKFKGIDGLYMAGQLNGSSGYEEAAAQGLIAGINLARYIDSKPPVILSRESSYIGVLIDDLVTKGTNEPYRMMTARAENRLNLRQENADERLTPLGREIGLVSDERYSRFCAKQSAMQQLRALLTKSVPPKDYTAYFEKIGEKTPNNGLTYHDMLKRANVLPAAMSETFEDLRSVNIRIFEELATQIKYEGYLAKQKDINDETAKLDSKLLPANLDYSQISGLRIEARQKLNKIQPTNVGQASRISGVSPADITVLLVWLKKAKL